MSTIFLTQASSQTTPDSNAPETPNLCFFASLRETPAGQLENLYQEILTGHPIANYGLSKIHLDTAIPYFSLCNGAYLVGYIARSNLQRLGRPWFLYILDYTCRHYTRTGPYRRETLLKKLSQECHRKLEN